MPEKKSDSKTSKPLKVKVPNVYAYIFYGGQVMKSGVGLIDVSDEHPEVKFNDYKKSYGNELKGRWVKCTISIDTVRDLVLQDLDEKKIGENLYKIDTTKAVEIIKKATGATKSTTIGVYSKKAGEEKKDGSDEESEEDEEDDKSKIKKDTKTKKSSKSEKEEEEVEVKKTKAKDVKKAKVESDDEEDTKKSKSKSNEKTKKTTKKASKVESEDESIKKSNNKQIVLSSDSEDEEED
jgi:hypothetical protein